METNNLPAGLRAKEVWTLSYRGLTIEIVHHDLEGKLRRDGLWNYYLYIYEHTVTPEVFKTLWLRDKIEKFRPESRGYVTHDYMQGQLSYLDWHGGITYYSKHGHEVGYRCVQAGCDYNHIWDEGYSYDLNYVLAEAKRTADQAVERFGIKEVA